jgi:hypothetical protein
VIDAFQGFLDGKFNWVELSLLAESIKLESQKTIQADENLQQLVNSTEARY